MTVVIELSARETSSLEQLAQRQGVPPDVAAHRLLAKCLPAAAADPSDPTLQILATWSAEDARQSPQEAEEEQRLWAEFERGVNGTRRSLGMRTL